MDPWLHRTRDLLSTIVVLLVLPDVAVALRGDEDATLTVNTLLGTVIDLLEEMRIKRQMDAL